MLESKELKQHHPAGLLCCGKYLLHNNYRDYITILWDEAPVVQFSANQPTCYLFSFFIHLAREQQCTVHNTIEHIAFCLSVKLWAGFIHAQDATHFINGLLNLKS